MVVRTALRFGFGTASLLAGGWVLRALQGTPASLGATPAEIAPVARRSPHYKEGKFLNLEASSSGLPMDRELQRKLLRDLANAPSVGKPPGPIPLKEPPKVDPTPADAAASWYGHSSVLIEVDGYRVLADPVWSERCSPSRTVGPQRLHDSFTALLQRRIDAGELDIPDPARAAGHFFTLLKGEPHSQAVFGFCCSNAPEPPDAHVASVVELFLRAYAVR